MNIVNVHRKNRSVTVMGTSVSFDANGAAVVDDAVGTQLLALGGYTRTDRPQEAPAKQTAAKADEEAPDLESMNTAQLRKLARDRNIDLGDATKKADIISAIESAGV